MQTKHRPYGELRDPIEERGGSMTHVRAGHQWGAWMVSLNGKRDRGRELGLVPHAGAEAGHLLPERGDLLSSQDRAIAVGMQT